MFADRESCGGRERVRRERGDAGEPIEGQLLVEVRVDELEDGDARVPSAPAAKSIGERSVSRPSCGADSSLLARGGPPRGASRAKRAVARSLREDVHRLLGQAPITVSVRILRGS
jgi:hypothetical protein